MESFDDTKEAGEETMASVVVVEDGDESEVEVCEFNYSVDEYFDVNEKIFSLCGSASDEQVADAHAIKQFSSMVTFLSEWKYFQYEPLKLKLSYESGTSGVSEDTTTEIHLSQFSSASVPKRERNAHKSTKLNSKDFLLHAGGSVWSLDWCPRVTESRDSYNNFEYLAVSAHPPGSAYHQMGLPLTGRGIVQIWGVLSVKREGVSSSTYESALQGRGKRRRKSLSAEGTLDSADEKKPCLSQRSRRRPTKQVFSGESSEPVAVLPKRPRGRPRKQLLPVEPPQISNEIVLFSSQESRPKRPGGRHRNISAITNSGCAGLVNCHDDFSLKLTPEDEVCLAELVRKKRQCKQDSVERPRQAPSRKNSSSVDLVSASMLACLHVPDGMVSTDATLASSTSVSKPNFHAAEQQYPRTRGRPRKNPSKDFSGVCKAHAGNSFPLTSLIASTEDNCGFLLKSSEHLVSHEQVRGTETFDIAHGESANLHQPANFVSGETALLPVKSVPPKNSKNDESLCNLTGRNSVRISSEFCSTDSLHNGCLSKTSTERGGISNRKMKNGTIPAVNDAFSPTLFTNNEAGKSYDSRVPELGSQGDTVASQNENGITNKEVTMPRIIFCLAHMGKVAWDVKWRPVANDFDGTYTMGFLAVLLGSGSLEVWEVPSPNLIKKLYASYNKKGTDPRFLRLEPVFKCSKLTRGGKQSIPLVVEWSPSPPFDLIIAGCHDGSVALWKFHKNKSTQDSNPLACFSAGNNPIRTLAWCPDESIGESANIILTAGHGELRFWDIRDPHRPLWQYVPVQRHILSVDWLKDVRCILISFDDGDLRLIWLQTTLSDTPVTGKVFSAPRPGTRSLAHSSFAIWSVQASRNNGVVAYCCADGSTKRFELLKNNIDSMCLQRVRRFLCGSLMVMGSDLLVHTPLPNHLLPVSQADMKQPKNKDTHKAGPNKGTIAAPKYKTHSKAEGEVHERTEIMCSLAEEELVNLQSETCTPLRTIESFPSKRIALHKVRWNKNRGSEQWLCHGGAAGIIRCQEITWPIP